MDYILCIIMAHLGAACTGWYGVHAGWKIGFYGEFDVAAIAMTVFGATVWFISCFAMLQVHT